MCILLFCLLMRMVALPTRRFCRKDKFEFKARTLAMHDAFAKVNENGVSIVAQASLDWSRHRSTEEYRRLLDEECVTLEDKIENHRKVLSGLQQDISLAERRVKGLTSMVLNLEKDKESVERELDSLASAVLDNADGKLSNEDKIVALHRQLADINAKLADKKQKLSDAEDKLDKLKKEAENIKERTEELRGEATQVATFGTAKRYVMKWPRLSMRM